MTHLNLTAARDLRPGDVIFIQGHPADLIEVAHVENATVLRWGVCDEDTVAVWSGRTFHRFPERMPC